MDDRQYALLARQPSAVLQNRERFCGMPKRGLAFLLANVMFWQPMWAQAGGIVVSGSGTSLGQAGNGVPIVNIAKPNGSGLSHNQFKDYNVGSNGVILNNATSRTQSTQLGGIVLGNPNLNGAAATTILNEVNGGSPSQLRGYTEVAGQSAHVIVANPYGITCNGCGFINTPQATLTTGKPVVENGQLTRYQVDQGSITVEGAGLNATNVDRFEIITRSAKINAEIQARNLTIVTGRNDVDATSLDATARADDGSTKPQLAIDSSALGGMYAGAIKLVGTEAGVGVKLDGKLIASGGDIQLDANGHLSLADTSATGAVNVKAASADVQGAVYAASVNVHTSGALDVQQSIAARDQISLSSGGQLTNNGVIEAGVNADTTRNVTGDVSLTAQNLNNSGKSVIASRNLTTHVTQTLNNQGGTLSAGQASTVEAGTLDNQNTGRVLSSKTLTVTADTLLNTQGVVSSDGHLTATVGQLNNHAGQIQSAQDMQLTVESLDNSQQGLLSSQAGLRVDGAQLNNAAGLLTAVGPVHLETSEVDNTGGRISSKSDLSANVAELTNQGGELVAQGPLTVNGQGLDNRNGGLVGATGALTLNVDAVDNRGGEISSSLGIDIDGLRLDNSDNGKVLAGTDLGLKVAEIINQTKGLLFSTGTSTVTGQSLDNSGGSLVARQGLDIRLDNALSNVAGLISSEGTLIANAGSLTNTLGSVSSAGALGLKLDNALLNQGGEIVTDAGLTVKSASLDNRNSGTISGKQGVLVETGAFDNSQSGRLSSGTSLDLTTQKLTNQNGGRIASNGALTVSVTDLDQQGGQLFSNTALTLDLNQGQLNNQNGLINAPLLMLKNLKGVNNDGGEISSAQAFTLAAQSLDNDSGKLLSNQALTLRVDNALTNLKGLIAAAALDVEAASLNNNGGTLTSRANLDLALSGQLDNQSNGLISAADALTVTTSGLNNQQGSLLGSAIAVDFGATTGDLNNSAGLITTAGTLSLKHLRDLNNQNGEISSSQSLDLNTRDLDNSAGQLISNGVLTVGARDVINQGGLLSGFKGLGLTAASLDNRNSGTLSSRDEDLSATLSGALLNGNAGALVGKKQLTVSAASLDNGGGILSSGGDQTLTVTGGLLNNAQGGLIDSGNALVINAMTLGNAGGTVNAQNALSVTGTTLDNTGGQLIGNAAVTLDLLGALTNTNGKLASVGPLRVDRATQITNQGGQIASQGLLTLLTAGLDNRNRGTVAANDQLILTSTGTVQNDADGLIYSQNGGVQIDAASLSNGKGTVQSQGAMTLTVANDLDNQSGRLQAKAGDLMVVARNLDNRGGVLASLQGLLTTQLSGVLKNGYDLNNNRQGGITQAQRLNLIALGGLDNYGGRISAQTGDASVTTRNFDNRNGGLYAKGKISVTANDFDNSGDNDGQIAGSQIDLDLTGALNNRLGIIESDSTLAIKAASLDNQTGQLRALGVGGKTEFQIGGLFDNRNGTLESANSDLILNAENFQNLGGSLLHVGTGLFDISTANLIAAGGSLVTRGGLTISTDTWSNSGVIQAGRLNVNVNNFTQTSTGQLLASTSLVGSGGNWSNDGLIASDGGLSLFLDESYSGSGRVSSVETLALNSPQLGIGVAGSISGGGVTTVKGTNSLINHGKITGTGGLVVSGANIENYGTLGSAQELVLTAEILKNDHALIFSQGDMALRVVGFTNTDSDVYSLAGLRVGKDSVGGLADRITNNSSTMKSDGDMSLLARLIENNRSELNYADAGIYAGHIFEVSCNSVLGLDCSGSHQNGVFEVALRSKLEVTSASAASSISAGGDLAIYGDRLLNRSSTITAGKNLLARLKTLTNIGVVAGEKESSSTYVVPSNYFLGEARKAAEIFNVFYWPEDPSYVFFDGGPQLLGSLLSNFINLTEREVAGSHRVSSLSVGDQSYAAVMQAGGKIDVVTEDNFDSGAVQNNYFYVVGNTRADIVPPSSGNGVRISLSAQLPPDLTQQQVNPLSLPGFALPTGQSGLFRLSGQAGSVQQATSVSAGPQIWSMGSASISPALRQQDLPDNQARSVQISAVDPVASSDRQLIPITPQTSTDNASTSGYSLPVTGQTLTRIQGLPDTSFKTNPQKYLIETNPALIELKQFMSSDYLLSNLGYDPDGSQKRLGDGLYEQRLIQQAVVARTGQRFIDGQTTDEGLFKYLMNNAIASKNALNLSLGVTLTAQQVAALTHDIVWLEEHEVNGEKVLVPVLYLAQANNRLAPNGALIAGKDMTLIAGKDLTNTGTLRATNNLSVTVGQSNINSGLIEAGNRLDLLAGNDIVNKSGGVIAGRDVSLNAVVGDVINERTFTTANASTRGYNQRQDYADNAARIEAANDLTMGIGQDLNNIGGVMVSGRDTRIDAGRDANIVSAQQQSSYSGGRRRSSITQLGSDVDAGRDVIVNAGQDFNAVASKINADRNVALDAVGNMTVSSGANESHSYYKSKKVTAQEDHVKQVGSTISAGGDVAMSAGKDMALVSSQVSAGDEAYLVAGEHLGVLAAQNSDYSLYDKKKKGSWGKKQTKHDEVTKVTNVGSQITTGGDLTLVSGDDQRYQAAKLESGNDLMLRSGGAIAFEGVKDLSQESHTKSNTSLAWNSMKGKGHTDETLIQSQLVAQGNLVIKAVDGLNIDIKNINQKTVSQTIDAMVKADPKLAWLKEAEQRGDVDWRLVKETHESFKYSSSSLGQGAMLAIIIIVTVLTAGAASAAVGSAATATAGSGTAMAAAGTASASAVASGAAVGSTVAAGWGNIALTSVITSAASGAAVSTINNKGNLGAVFKDVTSSDSMKGYLTSAAMAGMATGYNPATLGFNLQSLQAVLLKSTSDAFVNTAINGGSFNDNLGNSLVNQASNVGMAVGFKMVGDYSLGKYQEGSIQKVLAHALMGGLLAEATGGDFKTGAVAAGANEALINVLSNMVGGNKNLESMASQLTGLVAAAAVGGDPSKGAQIAQYATAYNRQLHYEEQKWLDENAKVFAQKEGITEQVAMERLSQQALKNTDYLWRSVLSDGDDGAALKFLSGAGKTFVNDLGQPQALFTATGQQLFRPEMFADTADPTFYKQFVQSGISRDLSSGLTKELKDSGIAVKDGAINLYDAVRENPKAVMGGLWEGVKGLPQSVVDSFQEGGNAIGEGAAVALDSELTAKLNAIYGVDVSTAQQALLFIRTASAITMAGTGAKVGGKLTGAAAEAVGKKLDEILNETAEKALLKNGGSTDLLAGAGGNWNVLDEFASPNVVTQSTPTACGAACGEMLLKDRGVLVSQVDLGTELTSMNSLANKLNSVDSGWVGNAVDSSSFNALNKTGSWSAMMWDSGNRVGHWVVVNGVDDAGRVNIKDPFNGTQYKMEVEQFKEAWNGHSVYKQ
ncbi:two-partner secretion domain-containing protein [Pseudomonas corrugata]|uniref:two-partner secretion domain-containing protein n=1 Tax=Pseudomonas corrugata TaxID=47879 RepID=UPI002234D303|nr:filamentous hemagglutinin N-terminal domain-containing protein [Pseudomonas corrugata]UZE08965.1 filamentous hemagglutinin N-terminal domain-containing protein [Pseudomonas corrugata]